MRRCHSVIGCLLISGSTLDRQLPALFLVIQLLGLACFAYIVAKRVAPLIRAECDLRLDRPWLRVQKLLKFWFGQWKHPRYRVAGTLHLCIFAGFIILATRAFYLLIFGLSNDFAAAGAVGRDLRHRCRLRCDHCLPGGHRRLQLGASSISPRVTPFRQKYGERPSR